MTWIRNRPHGLVYRDAQKSWDGLTLFSSVTGHHATLINPEGLVVHRWYQSEGIQHAQMLDNGHLLIQTKPFRHSEGRQNMGGSAGALMELDWDSNVVWAYRNPAMHHDFERLPNGNHIVLTWHPVPDEYRERVRGGHHHESEGDVMWGDVILEIDRSGFEVRRWNSWEHFDPELDVICPLESHKEWSHANALSITSDGDWLVSFRLRAPAFSRVLEVNPESREVVWKYQAEVILAFYSFMCSGASRLPNGNTFITEAATGRLFEVTEEGETVWEYVSPFNYTSRFGKTPAVFRAYRYATDDPRLNGRELDSAKHAELNEMIRESAVPDNYTEPVRRR